MASGADVAQAETQLYTTRQAQLVDLGVARAQYEHAIAILVGKPPAAVTVSAGVLKDAPPAVPVTMSPSVLLERRPDIAAAERQMAAVQEQIGIAVAAYYPTLNLKRRIGLRPRRNSPRASYGRAARSPWVRHSPRRSSKVASVRPQ